MFVYTRWDGGEQAAGRLYIHELLGKLMGFWFQNGGDMEDVFGARRMPIFWLRELWIGGKRGPSWKGVGPGGKGAMIGDEISPR